MSNRTEPRETTEGSRLRRTGEWLATSRTTGIAAAVFCALLAVVVAVAVVIAVTRDDDSVGAGAPTATQPPATAPAKPDSGTAFGVPSADLFGRVIANPVNPRGQALPQSQADRPSFKEGDPVPAPEGLMWQQVGPFILPFSTSDGPTSSRWPIGHGFRSHPPGRCARCLADQHADGHRPGITRCGLRQPDRTLDTGEQGVVGAEEVDRLEPAAPSVHPGSIQDFRLER
ncbi:hypothetical protein ACQGAO_00190 [Rhodococcus sp. 1.20]